MEVRPSEGWVEPPPVPPWQYWRATPEIAEQGSLDGLVLGLELGVGLGDGAAAARLATSTRAV
ncbi:hypothetical protein GCM10009753_33970 [Streptantibioticus ferralitis]